MTDSANRNTILRLIQESRLAETPNMHNNAADFLNQRENQYTNHSKDGPYRVSVKGCGSMDIRDKENIPLAAAVLASPEGSSVHGAKISAMEALLRNGPDTGLITVKDGAGRALPPPDAVDFAYLNREAETDRSREFPDTPPKHCIYVIMGEYGKGKEDLADELCKSFALRRAQMYSTDPETSGTALSADEFRDRVESGDLYFTGTSDTYHSSAFSAADLKTKDVFVTGREGADLLRLVHKADPAIEVRTIHVTEPEKIRREQMKANGFSRRDMVSKIRIEERIYDDAPCDLRIAGLTDIAGAVQKTAAYMRSPVRSQATIEAEAITAAFLEKEAQREHLRTSARNNLHADAGQALPWGGLSPVPDNDLGINPYIVLYALTGEHPEKFGIRRIPFADIGRADTARDAPEIPGSTDIPLSDGDIPFPDDEQRAQDDAFYQDEDVPDGGWVRGDDEIPVPENDIPPEAPLLEEDIPDEVISIGDNAIHAAEDNPLNEDESYFLSERQCDPAPEGYFSLNLNELVDRGVFATPQEAQEFMNSQADPGGGAAPAKENSEKREPARGDEAPDTVISEPETGITPDGYEMPDDRDAPPEHAEPCPEIPEDPLKGPGEQSTGQAAEKDVPAGEITRVDPDSFWTVARDASVRIQSRDARENFADILIANPKMSLDNQLAILAQLNDGEKPDTCKTAREWAAEGRAVPKGTPAFLTKTLAVGGAEPNRLLYPKSSTVVRQPKKQADEQYFHPRSVAFALTGKPEIKGDSAGKAAVQALTAIAEKSIRTELAGRGFDKEEKKAIQSAAVYITARRLGLQDAPKALLKPYLGVSDVTANKVSSAISRIVCTLDREVDDRIKNGPRIEQKKGILPKMSEIRDSLAGLRPKKPNLGSNSYSR